MNTIQFTKTTFGLKDGTKTAYQPIETETGEFTEQQYDNFIEAASFFRRLGGSETNVKNYTSRGYRVVRNISKSPDRKTKVVTEFNF